MPIRFYKLVIFDKVNDDLVLEWEPLPKHAADIFYHYFNLCFLSSKNFYIEKREVFNN